MVSASSEKENVIKAIGSGQVWKYILKPWKDEELIALVKEGVARYFREFSLNEKDSAERIKNKIFFLCPPQELKGDLILDFIHRGFECCTLDDPHHAELMLAKYKDSVVIINIDKKLKDFSWDKYILSLMGNDKIKNGLIGVCSASPDLSTQNKYIKKMQIPLGFIQIKKNIAQTRDAVLGVLNKLSNSDRRQFIRIKIKNQDDGIINIKHLNRIYTGNIINISSDVMACTFSEPLQIEIDEKIDNMQLKLKGVPIKTAGQIKIKKIQNGKVLFVVRFHHNNSPDADIKICKFTSKALQEAIEFDINNELILERSRLDVKKKKSDN
jgi:hypothetical protein